MLYSGLTSVTFRKLNPQQIVLLARQAGIDAIEWGGDVHVPHGDLKTAKDVLLMTKESGLLVSSYGSYYKAGAAIGKSTGFIKVLETCIALKTNTVRIWAGNIGSNECDDKTWETVVYDIQQAAEMCRKENIDIGLEYHSNTLTDTLCSTMKLLDDVDRNNVFTYWQPCVKLSDTQNLNELESLLCKVSNVHVFTWDKKDRLPLAEGKDEWKKRFELLRLTKKDHFCIMEFVKNDDPKIFLEDAKTLKNMIAVNNDR